VDGWGECSGPLVLAGRNLNAIGWPCGRASERFFEQVRRATGKGQRHGAPPVHSQASVIANGLGHDKRDVVNT
jgi:hypothetical protein